MVFLIAERITVMPYKAFHQLVSDDRFPEKILDNLSDGIIAHDVSRRILFFNRAAEKITGYSRDEVLGKDCHEAFGRPFCGGRCSFEGEQVRLPEKRCYPLNIHTKEGGYRRVEMTVTMMDNGPDDTLGVIASFRDVTELIGLRIEAGGLEGFAGIIGKHPRMLEIYRQIRELGGNSYPVCITGETGTGKELVATAIHNESRRGGHPFVPVNCAALPGGILESELFGHVKGAFTGAIKDKKGRFELANTGTLFLDEIADLPKDLQAKLLRVLQEHLIEPVGSEIQKKVDVRLISATNKNLRQEVKKGNFRDDLFYRVNVVPIHIPPLRERKSDIPLLVEHLFQNSISEGHENPGISKEVLDIMVNYSWPGNVRELQSAIRFALVKSNGKVIRPRHLPQELRDSRGKGPLTGYKRKLDVESVRTALIQSGGNKAKAARILGVGRATLYRFLKDFPELSPNI